MAATHREELSDEQQDVASGRAPDPGSQEVLGSRGGLKYFHRRNVDIQTNTQFHGRLLPPAIHRPEERVR